MNNIKNKILHTICNNIHHKHYDYINNNVNIYLYAKIIFNLNDNTRFNTKPIVKRNLELEING